MISRLPSLKYLDDRPVFDEDRRFAEAWAKGGLEEERKERETFKKEKEDEHMRNHLAFKEMIKKAKEERLKA
jgi:dynein assembly factor 1